MFDYKFHSFGNKHLVASKTQQYIVRQERPNYKEGYVYCNTDKRNFPKELIKCPICNHFLRRRPQSRKKLEFPRH